MQTFSWKLIFKPLYEHRGNHLPVPAENTTLNWSSWAASDGAQQSTVLQIESRGSKN